MNKLWFLICCLPLKHISLTSGYGCRLHPVTGKYAFHAGVDLRAHADTVYAIASGLVEAGYQPLLGNYIRIRSGCLETVYGHLSQIFFLTGDSVSACEPLALSGATGRVTGEHLHFAVAISGRYINPLPFLFFAMQHINNK